MMDREEECDAVTWEYEAAAIDEDIGQEEDAAFQPGELGMYIELNRLSWSSSGSFGGQDVADLNALSWGSNASCSTSATSTPNIKQMRWGDASTTASATSASANCWSKAKALADTEPEAEVPELPEVEAPSEPRRPEVVEALEKPSTSVCADLLASMATSAMLAIFVTPADAAIISSVREAGTSFQEVLANTLRSYVTHPAAFAPNLRWTFFNFMAIYSAACLMRSFCQKRHLDPTFRVWLSTAIMGCSIGLLKDAVLAGGSFGMPPRGALAIWLARDALHFGVIFALPGPLAAQLSPWLGPKVLGGRLKLEDLIQLLLPLALQLATSPLHALGLSFITHPTVFIRRGWLRRGYTEALSPSARLRFMTEAYLARVGTRCVRMFVPWAVAPIIIRNVRQRLTTFFAGRRSGGPVAAASEADDIGGTSAQAVRCWLRGAAMVKAIVAAALATGVVVGAATAGGARLVAAVLAAAAAAAAMLAGAGATPGRHRSGMAAAAVAAVIRCRGRRPRRIAAARPSLVLGGVQGAATDERR